MYENYNKMEDNLRIVQRRLHQMAAPNMRRYGLVRQVGPWTPTQEDLIEIFATPQKFGNGNYPRDYDTIEPDAVPNGVDPDLLYMPLNLGGGFSLFDGKVVEPPIYDARVTAPGKKMWGQPLEHLGKMAMRIAVGSEIISTKPKPSVDPDPEVLPKPPKDPKDPKDPDSKDPPLTKEEWEIIKNYQKEFMYTRMTPFGPLYSPQEMIKIWEQMTQDEKRFATKALTEFRKLSDDEKFYEWHNPNSVMRRVYTLYTGEQAAYYTWDFMKKALQFAFIAALFAAKIYSS